MMSLSQKSDSFFFLLLLQQVNLLVPISYKIGTDGFTCPSINKYR